MWLVALKSGNLEHILCILSVYLLLLRDLYICWKRIEFSKCRDLRHVFFPQNVNLVRTSKAKSSPILSNDRLEFSEKIGCYSIRAGRQSAILVPSGTKELHGA